MGKASRRKMDLRTKDVAQRTKDVEQRARVALEAIAGSNWINRKSSRPEGEKITYALITLLEAEVPKGSPIEVYKAALDLIAICWNMSALEGDERSKAIQVVTKSLVEADDTIRREAVDQLERLMARKLAHFPHDDRIILSWDVWLEGGQLGIVATAATSPG